MKNANADERGDNAREDNAGTKKGGKKAPAEAKGKQTAKGKPNVSQPHTIDNPRIRNL